MFTLPSRQMPIRTRTSILHKPSQFTVFYGEIALLTEVNRALLHRKEFTHCQWSLLSTAGWIGAVSSIPNWETAANSTVVRLDKQTYVYWLANASR
jgi:hypothetical protein